MLNDETHLNKIRKEVAANCQDKKVDLRNYCCSAISKMLQEIRFFNGSIKVGFFLK